MADSALEAGFRGEVLRAIAGGAPRHEIMTMLMSNGWKEIEANDFITRLTKEAPPIVSGPRRTDASSGMPVIIVGGIMLLAGFAIPMFFDRSESLLAQRGLLIGGVLVMGRGLTRIATGSD